MEVYKTYKAAVISNGSVDGVTTDGNQFFTGSSLRTHKPCNPVDHLESVADFRARGLQLREGDAWVDFTGLVRYVTNPKAMNNPHSSDSDLFILQSATDQVETPEEKEAFDAIDTTPLQVESLGKAEWSNGDSVVFGKDDRSGIYIAYDAYNEGHVVYSGGDYFYVLDGGLSKPETPAEREERERLESARELYLFANKAMQGADIVNHYNFEQSECIWLALVDKTGYRKQ